MTRYAVLDISAVGVRYVVTTPTPSGCFDVVDRADVALPLGRTPARDVAARSGMLELLASTCRRLVGSQRPAPSLTAVRARVTTQLGEDHVGAALASVGMWPVLHVPAIAEPRFVLRAAQAALGLGNRPMLSIEIEADAIRLAAGPASSVVGTVNVPFGIADLLRGPPALAARRWDVTRARLRSALAPFADVTSPYATISAPAMEPLFRSVGRAGLPVADAGTLTVDQARTALADLERRVDGSSESALLPAGIEGVRLAMAILLSISQEVDLSSITYTRHGLTSGLVLEAGRNRVRTRPEAAIRRDTVDDMVDRFGVDRAQAARIARTSVRIYDALGGLARRSPEDRELLTSAAHLLDVAVGQVEARHHRVGGEIVGGSELRGFAPQARAIVASLVRFQKGRPPSARFPLYAALDLEQRRRVHRLCAVLRLAAGAHIGRDIEFLHVDVDADADADLVVLTFQGQGDLEFARFGARSSGDLFERVFGRRLVVQLGAPARITRHEHVDLTAGVPD